MNDKYFEKKVDMIIDIMDLMILHRNDAGLVENHEKNIKLILKEISKDQRHACAEAVLKFGEIGERATVESIHSVVMNTHINKEG